MSDRSQWTGWHLWKRRTELSNAGHKMDEEMFITHLLNSLPQSEYEGAILVIKDKLRKGKVDLPEIEQILEDKYQSMKHVKDWDEEEDDYALFTSHSNKKRPKKQFKGCCGYCGEFGHKAADCPNKKSNQNKGFKKHSTKGENKGKGHKDMSKIVMLILLKKMSKTRNSRICWIWTRVV